MPVRVGTQGPTAPPMRLNRLLAKGAERGGFDSYWALDHMMGFIPPGMWTPKLTPLARVMKEPEAFYDPLVLLGLLATRTKRIRLGTAVLDTVRLHPAWIARAALTLQHASKGRFILGLGAGERENIGPYGLPFDRLVSRCRESLEVIRLLWSTPGPVDYKGEFFTLERASLELRPLQKPPPIWLAAHGPKMLELTGRYCDGWLPHDLSLERWTAGLERIRVAARAAGRNPADVTPAAFVNTVIDSSHEAAHRALQQAVVKIGALSLYGDVWADAGGHHPLGDDYGGILDFVPTDFTPERMRELIDGIPWDVLHGLFLHGEPEEVVEHLRPYVAAGCREIVFQNFTALARPARVLQSTSAFIRTARLLHRLG
ncbi:MAG: LLM class flavin-dependent oxidoreductase [Actinomycetota bacterium]